MLLSCGVLSMGLMAAALRAVLIMLIVVCVWFELHNPGMGFPSFAAAVAAVIFFVSLHIDGLADYREIILSVVGLVLLFLDIILTPGFGMMGAIGIVCTIVGLTFSLIDNSVPFEGATFCSALLYVVICVSAGFAICICLTSKIGKGKSSYCKSARKNANGSFVELQAAVGHEGIATTALRPGGKVSVDGQLYDAVALNGYIDEGESIHVDSTEAGQLYVTKL